MDCSISTRIPESLSRELDHAEMENRSQIVRHALMDDLIDSTTGVCSISGRRCYESSFDVDSSSPLGQFIDIPESLDSIQLSSEKFDELSTLHAQGKSIDIDREEFYMNQVGLSTYRAETRYLANADSEMDSRDLMYARVPLMGYSSPGEFNEIRLVSLLVWSYRNAKPLSSVSPQSIWEEHSREVQNGVIGRAYHNPETTLKEILDGLDVYYSRRPGCVD